MKAFSDYAKYYDLLYQQKDYKSEVEYIVTLLDKFAKNPNKILELGCGTGQHAVHLANLGYEVNGVDRSKKMVKIANEHKQKLPIDISDLLHFSTADVRTFISGKSYDAIISLFHVISYQTSNDDLIKTFNAVAKQLKPGGIFIFDCWYGPAVISDKPYNRMKQFENENLLVTRHATPQIYPLLNSVDVNFEIEILNKKTRISNSINETHKMRYLFNPEIEHFLEINGLKVTHSEEWLTGKEPSFNSWYVTFICTNK